jgi:hypothetical protein
MIVFLIRAFFLYLHASWLHGHLGITDSLTSYIDVFEYLPVDYQLRLIFPSIVLSDAVFVFGMLTDHMYIIETYAMNIALLL